jgi:uncharacterized membrane protein YkoI
MNVRKTITTSALAVGVLVGSAGLANAMTSSGSPAQQVPAPPAADGDQDQDPMLDGSIQLAESEGRSEAEESSSMAALATITDAEATEAAVAANPDATVDAVELGNENGSVVFEVTMTDSSGASLEVKVDAGNGTVLAQESGDEVDERVDDD